MADSMMFHEDWKEFLEDYSFIDHKAFYTNGARLIPTFRVEQMIEHYFATENNVGHKNEPIRQNYEDELKIRCAELSELKHLYEDCVMKIQNWASSTKSY